MLGVSFLALDTLIKMKVSIQEGRNTREGEYNVDRKTKSLIRQVFCAVGIGAGVIALFLLYFFYLLGSEHPGQLNRKQGVKIERGTNL